MQVKFSSGQKLILSTKLFSHRRFSIKKIIIKFLRITLASCVSKRFLNSWTNYLDTVILVVFFLQRTEVASRSAANLLSVPSAYSAMRPDLGSSSVPWILYSTVSYLLVVIINSEMFWLFGGLGGTDSSATGSYRMVPLLKELFFKNINWHLIKKPQLL